MYGQSSSFVKQQLRASQTYSRQTTTTTSSTSTSTTLMSHCARNTMEKRKLITSSTTVNSDCDSDSADYLPKCPSESEEMTGRKRSIHEVACIPTKNEETTLESLNKLRRSFSSKKNVINETHLAVLEVELHDLYWEVREERRRRKAENEI